MRRPLLLSLWPAGGRGPHSVALAARDGEVRRFSALGLPDLRVDGLDADAGGQLLTERVGVAIPLEVLSRLMEATRGNPLALVELPSLITPGQFSGREPLPSPLPMTNAVQRIFVQRVRRLPKHTQRLLLVAAADETCRLATVLAAAAELGVPAAALDPAERADLIAIQSGQPRSIIRWCGHRSTSRPATPSGAARTARSLRFSSKRLTSTGEHGTSRWRPYGRTSLWCSFLSRPPYARGVAEALKRPAWLWSGRQS